MAETPNPPRDRRRQRANDRLLYRLADAASAVGVSVSGLRDEIRAGRLEARRMGRAVLIPAESLSRWSENLPPAA